MNTNTYDYPHHCIVSYMDLLLQLSNLHIPIGTLVSHKITTHSLASYVATCIVAQSMVLQGSCM